MINIQGPKASALSKQAKVGKKSQSGKIGWGMMRGPVVVAGGTVLAPVTHVTDLANYSTQLSKLSKLSSLHPAQAVAHHRVWREELALRATLDI